MMPRFELIRRLNNLKQMSESPYDCETYHEALNAIGGNDTDWKKEDASAVYPGAIPTADEALAILNENDHGDDAWVLVASHQTPDDDGRIPTLSYPELIGTAMYYQALDKREESNQ
jgi:hypothetical protein